MTLRAVFLGSPEFAVPSLDALVSDPEIDVPLVVTQPDRPSGRGKKVTPPPVKQPAQRHDIELYQPESLRDAAAVEVLRKAEPDLLVVVAYGEILRKSVLELAPHGALNVHPSLLPKYRGAAPIPATILNGDTRTGVSIIKLVRRMDAGPILAQREIDVEPEETSKTLSEKLAGLAAEFLPVVCKAWASGELEAREQDESRASYTREWSRADAEIDWSRPVDEIERLVRAAQPWPVAWTMYGDKPFRVHEASIKEGRTRAEPGTVNFLDGKVLVAAGDGGVLVLERVQPAGSRAMSGVDWWNGLHELDVVLGRR